MIYYVVNDRRNETATALLFHDPSSNYYFIKSKSEVFRRSFYAALNLVKVSFIKEHNALTFDNLDLSNPYWSKKVLDKACGSFWYISESNEIDFNTQVDDVVEKYL